MKQTFGLRRILSALVLGALLLAPYVVEAKNCDGVANDSDCSQGLAQDVNHDPKDDGPADMIPQTEEAALSEQETESPTVSGNHVIAFHIRARRPGTWHIHSAFH